MYKKHWQKFGLDLDLSFYILNGNMKNPQNIKKALKIFLPSYTPKQFLFFCRKILSWDCLFSIRKKKIQEHSMD